MRASLGEVRRDVEVEEEEGLSATPTSVAASPGRAVGKQVGAAAIVLC